MSTSVKILDARVDWVDNASNDPWVRFVVDRTPVFDTYTKTPCARETLSSEQAIVVGSRMSRPNPNWHLYWSTDGDWAWGFTWGGKPDRGFGGWRRRIVLDDGTSEDIVGGWHVGTALPRELGLGAYVDTSCVLEGERVGLARCLSEDAFKAAVDEHLSYCEVLRSQRYGWLTVKIKDQPSKVEWVEMENERRRVLMEDLRERYAEQWAKVVERRGWGEHMLDSSRFIEILSDEDAAELKTRHYSSLLPVAT